LFGHRRLRRVNEEAAFLSAIKAGWQDEAKRDDDMVRLVYADWLDERNDPRGEYLRLDVEIRRHERDKLPLAPELRSRHRELEERIDHEWVSIVSLSSLVRRLLVRICREPTVDYLQEPPIRPRPPLSAAALAAAESRLGFHLPPLLRALYTQVGDGGYGPGRGLEVLAEGEWSLVAHVEAVRRPDRLIPLISWGCLYWSWVDCSAPPYPVWFDDTDFNVEGAPESDFFYRQADSLSGWLSAWLDGVDLWAAGKRRNPAGPHAPPNPAT
jgi:uncharacterized protein (TIGR02996 family)